MPNDNFFTPLNDEDKRTNILSTISSPVWSGGATTLTAFYTSSVQLLYSFGTTFVQLWYNCGTTVVQLLYCFGTPGV